MAIKLFPPTQLSLHIFRPKSSSLNRVLYFPSRFISTSRILLPVSSSICINSNLFAKHFSTTKTPNPLQYEMIISRPTQSSLARPRFRRQNIEPSHAESGDSSESDSSPESEELHFDHWVDRKLSKGDSQSDNAMDKSKRKYYSKGMKRMYGLEADDKERKKSEGNSLVELESEAVELRTLHKKDEELYFYDTFAYPWEKDKHYKMASQLEKKYFPDQCLDKAFLEPGETNLKNSKKMEKAVNNVIKEVAENVRDERKEEDKGLVFFYDKESSKDVKKEISEKNKFLKKIPNIDDQISKMEPYLLTRSSELPAKWDSPGGTVVLVNKPKGWTSFTVCGKLRRLVKVKKMCISLLKDANDLDFTDSMVGHCGTLDPMATGLLIICVGRATKVVDRYQGMIKGYSGVFRLGESTSTLDADSPVIHRAPWEHIKDSEIKRVAESFCGEIWQVPPMFSAIKVGGEKMYEKARKGESVELSPRQISIFKFEIERSLEDRQNLIYRVVCSKGTYIRSLCADLGKALGSCAHLTAIRRDSIGEYAADDAWDFKELEEAITKNYM